MELKEIYREISENEWLIIDFPILEEHLTDFLQFLASNYQPKKVDNETIHLGDEKCVIGTVIIDPLDLSNQIPTSAYIITFEGYIVEGNTLIDATTLISLLIFNFSGSIFHVCGAPRRRAMKQFFWFLNETSQKWSESRESIESYKKRIRNEMAWLHSFTEKETPIPQIRLINQPEGTSADVSKHESNNVHSPETLKEQAKYVYSFQKSGEYWRIQFEDEEGLFKDVKGLRCIQFLLSKPGKAFSAIILEHQVSQSSYGGEKPVDYDSDLVLTKFDDSELRMDADAIKSITSHLRQLKSDRALAEQRNESTTEIDEEISQIEKNLLPDLNKKGRSRRYKSPAENARINLTQRIRSAEIKVKKSMPKFFKHLDLYIETGGEFIYKNDNINWEMKK